jgi:hypothetical protein
MAEDASPKLAIEVQSLVLVKFNYTQNSKEIFSVAPINYFHCLSPPSAEIDVNFLWVYLPSSKFFIKFQLAEVT